MIWFIKMSQAFASYEHSAIVVIGVVRYVEGRQVKYNEVVTSPS